MAILHLWRKDVLSPPGEASVAVLFPDSPSQKYLSAVVLNTRVGEEVTWLGMTASSTTPADNVFLDLWLFYIFIGHMRSAAVHSASLTSHLRAKEKCVIVFVAASPSDVRVNITLLLLLKADLMPTCSYTEKYWNFQFFILHNLHCAWQLMLRISNETRSLFLDFYEVNRHCIDIAASFNRNVAHMEILVTMAITSHSYTDLLYEIVFSVLTVY